jgi:hypothetical protein
MKKECPKTRPEKTSKFDRKFIPKWEGLGDENEGFAGDLLQNRGFRGIVKYWKIGAKRDPKNDQKQSQKRSEIRFLRFLGVLGGAEI